jgi:hypothetical protein
VLDDFHDHLEYHQHSGADWRFSPEDCTKASTWTAAREAGVLQSGQYYHRKAAV